MPSNAAGLAWASFIANLGQSVPDMLRSYNRDVAVEQEEAKKRAAREGVDRILGEMPEYGAIPKGMSPAEAMNAWLKSSPEDKAKAKAVVGGQFVPPAAKASPTIPEWNPPDMSNVGGSALSALASPTTRDLDDDTLKGIVNVIGSIEGSGNYAARHPQAANGLQAIGKYGIVPSLWFKALPQYGLDPQKPEDVRRFEASPELQDAMAKDIVRQLWGEAGGDPRKFIARYYSGSDSTIGTPDEWKPQWAVQNGQRIPMPSIGEHADKFLKTLRTSGYDPDVLSPPSADSFPYDNRALLEMTKAKPRLERRPRRVTYQDQERYLLENVKDPEQLALVKDYMANITRLADLEREEGKERSEAFRDEMEQYGKNVVELSKQALEVWKTRFQAQNQRRTASSKARDEHRMYLKDLAGRLQQRLKDISSWQINYLRADDDQRELLRTQFPEFFKLQPKTSFWSGTKMEEDVDIDSIEKEILRVRNQINKIEQALAPRAGVEFEGAAGAEEVLPQNFFIN